MHWDLVSACVTGRSHEKKGTPNQDAYTLDQTPTGIILGVADGHGSSVCFRSHVGSKLATQVVVDQAKPLDTQKLDALTQDEAKAFTRKWAERTLKYWVKAVLDHLRENPFTLEEVDGLDEAGRRGLGKNALLAYGSTLMGLIVTPQRVLAYNLGDGDILYFKKKEVVKTVFEDQAMIGNSTYSLCTSGSVSKIAHLDVETKDLDLIMVATDGYRNSFKNEKGFYKAGKDFMKIKKKYGFEVVKNHMEEWLKETTDGGSGDDLTCVLVFKSDEKD